MFPLFGYLHCGLDKEDLGGQSVGEGVRYEAFVESVGLDGSWTISEMNFKGWDIVDSRTLKASDAKNFNYIH